MVKAQKSKEQLIAELGEVKHQVNELNELKIKYKKIVNLNRKLEVKFREQQTFFESIYNGIDTAIFIVDVTKEGDFRYADNNRIHQKAMGLSLEEFRGKKPEDLVPHIPKEVAAAVRTNYQRCVDSGKPIHYDEKLVVDGREIWVLTHLTPIRDAYDRIYRIVGLSKDITERKRTEEALKESESRYRTLFESAGDAIFMMKKDIFISCNQRVVELFGYTKEQFIGKRPYDFSPAAQPDGHNSKERALEKINAALNNKPQFFEWQHLTSTNELIEVEVTLNRLELGSGDYVQAIVRDISERKRQEKLLQDRLNFETIITNLSAEFINLPAHMVDEAIENALNIIADFFGAGRSVIIQRPNDGKDYYLTHSYSANGIKPMSANINIDKQFASAAAHLLQGNIFIVSRLADLPEKAQLMRHYYEQEGIKSSIAIPLIVAGSFIGSLSISIFDKERDWPEELVRRLCLAGQIIANALMRKKAEEEIRSAKEFSESLIETANAIILTLDNKANITLFNKFAENITGHTKEEVLGKNWFESFIPKRDRSDLPNVFKNVFQQMPAFTTYENPIVCKNGKECLVEWKNTILKNQKGEINGVLSIGADITERKRAEEKLQTYQQRLRSLVTQLSKVEENERKEIATEIHDRIGQTLAISKLKLEGLLDPLTSTPFSVSLKEILDLLDQAIHDTRTLTFEISPTILYVLGFEAAIDWLSEQYKKRFNLDIKVSDDGHLKSVDNEVCMVLFKGVRELLTNIVKHAKTKSATIFIERESQCIKVQVIDEGIGFDIPHTGFRFSTSGGFGLFNIRERLEFLGGNLKIESAAGKGTRATLLAPLQENK